MAIKEIRLNEIPEDLKRTFGLEQQAIQSIDREIPQETANQLLAEKKSTTDTTNPGYFESRDIVEEVDLAKIVVGTLFRSNISGISLELLGLEAVDGIQKVKIKQFPFPKDRNPNEYGHYEMEKFMDRYVYKAQERPLGRRSRT